MVISSNIRYFLTFICLMLFVNSNAQDLHLGVGWGYNHSSFETQSRTYYFAYSDNFVENQEVLLRALNKQRAIQSPSIYARFEAKNLWMLYSSLKTVSYQFDYNLETSYSDGFRVNLLALDYGLSAGMRLFQYKAINLIPEVGIVAQFPLSVNERRISDAGTVSNEELKESDPQLAGVRATLITNQTMDFENSILFARAGFTIKYYNLYLTADYSRNFTAIDKSEFYTSGSLFSVSIAADILSFHLLKNQGNHFEN